MKRIFYIGFLVLLFASCEEYFVPDIDPQESVLVFEGLLTNEPKVHTVKITESVPYNQDRDPEKVSGYRVYIEAENGEGVLLSEADDGIYVTDDNIAGEIGEKYRLVVSRNTGELYMSNYELLSPGVPIDSITGEATYETILKYYEGPGYVEEITRGMTILDDVKGTKENAYCRYEYDLVFQTTQTYPFQPSPYVAYIARPTSSNNLDYISILNCNLYTNLFALNNPVEFIDEDAMDYKVTLPDIEYDDNGDPLFEADEIRVIGYGFLVNLKQYSLSQSGFYFWNAIYEQSQASGQLFDPVESQVVGNMYDGNDSTKMVFGYFGASSVNIKGMHLKLRSNDRIEVDPIIYFPDLDGTIDSDEPFDFWVN